MGKGSSWFDKLMFWKKPKGTTKVVIPSWPDEKDLYTNWRDIPRVESPPKPSIIRKEYNPYARRTEDDSIAMYALGGTVVANFGQEPFQYPAEAEVFVRGEDGSFGGGGASADWSDCSSSSSDSGSSSCSGGND